MGSREPFSEIIFSVALLLFTEIRDSSWDHFFVVSRGTRALWFGASRCAEYPRSEFLRHSIFFGLRTKAAQLCGGAAEQPAGQHALQPAGQLAVRRSSELPA